MERKYIIFYIFIVYILMILTGELLVEYLTPIFTIMVSVLLGISMGSVIMLPYKWEVDKRVNNPKTKK